MSHDQLYKLLVVGDACAGKSSMVTRFMDDAFDQPFVSTIGVDFKIKTLAFHDKVVKLQVWDLAAGDRVRIITSSYYRGAHGVFIVYDTSDENSFNSVARWYQETQKFAKVDVSVVLLGAKCDLTTKKKVNFITAKEFAESKGIPFIETSAKYSINIDLAFYMMISDIHSTIGNEDNTVFSQHVSQPKKPSSCCIS